MEAMAFSTLTWVLPLIWVNALGANKLDNP
jgi:hypothetical protein